METGKVSTIVPSIPGYEEIIVEAVGAMARIHEVPYEKLNKLKIAVNEACINAMDHGNDYDPTKNVEITFEYNDESLSVSVTDSGSGNVSPNFDEPDLDEQFELFKTMEQEISGWGLFLMKSLVDDVEIVGKEGEGTTTTVTILHEHE